MLGQRFGGVYRGVVVVLTILEITLTDVSYMLAYNLLIGLPLVPLFLM